MSQAASCTLVALVVLGCSAGSGSRSLVVGDQAAGGRAGTPSGSGGGAVLITGDASVSSALSAHIESPRGVTVDFVTVSCSERCADVIAVAKGGVPPYAYTWEDGSKDPARNVCPTSTTQYAVTVTDTGVSTAEFERDPQTVKAPLTANVIRCSDGAVSPADSGRPGGAACITNPSIEGTPQSIVIGRWDAAGWEQCPLLGLFPTFLANETINGVLANVATPRPTDGNTYAVIQVTPPSLVGFGQRLCAPVLPGNSRSFTVDAMWGDTSTGPSPTPPELEVLGGDAPCTGTNVLWTSPPLTKSWVTYCVTIRSTAPTSSLTFNAADNGANGAVFVDHVVPIATCL